MKQKFRLQIERNFFEMLIEKIFPQAKKNIFEQREKTKFNSRKLGKCFENSSNTRIQNYKCDGIVLEKISRMTHTYVNTEYTLFL